MAAPEGPLLLSLPARRCVPARCWGWDNGRSAVDSVCSNVSSHAAKRNRVRGRHEGYRRSKTHSCWGPPVRRDFRKVKYRLIDGDGGGGLKIESLFPKTWLSRITHIHADTSRALIMVYERYFSTSPLTQYKYQCVYMPAHASLRYCDAT